MQGLLATCSIYNMDYMKIKEVQVSRDFVGEKEKMRREKHLSLFAFFFFLFSVPKSLSKLGHVKITES